MTYFYFWSTETIKKKTESMSQKHKMFNYFFCHDLDLFLLVLYCSVDDIDQCKTFIITAGKVL